jgi:CubicO group peptidase (beta-lactamase class C family)
MYRCFVVLFFLCFVLFPAAAQNRAAFADSIRKVCQMPALSYAVISADSVYEIQALGERKLNSGLPATLSDRYRLGSNTKAITGFLAAQLVKQGKITWHTRFFDLFPEMKPASRRIYHDLTLLDLLTFRTRLYPYTYTDTKPATNEITGSEAMQRSLLMQWVFSHRPVRKKDSVSFSNPGYVAAAMMLEKASGQSFTTLVTELGNTIGADFAFGPPNLQDTLQTWGHNENGQPEAPADNPRLNWLLPAGNINATLPHYIRFIQLQLKGLQGRSDLLSQEEFNFLHYGRSRFAVGWFVNTSAPDHTFTWHVGNPGTYLSKVYVYRRSGIAIIVFTNIQSAAADQGTNLLIDRLSALHNQP